MDRDLSGVDWQLAVGLNKASAFTVGVFVALRELRGEEQYAAAGMELAELAELFACAPYRYTGTLADEFVRMVRGECKKGLTPAQIAGVMCFRAAVWNLEAELCKRNCRHGGGKDGDAKAG